MTAQTGIEKTPLSPDIIHKGEALQEKIDSAHTESDGTDSITQEEFWDLRDVAHFCTDTGNAARLVCREGKNIRYCGAWGQWLVWDGIRWKPDADLEMERLAKDTALAIFDEVKTAAEKHGNGKSVTELGRWATRSQDRAKIKATIDLARSEVPISPDKLDTDRFLLNAQNGTVDLRTGKLREHRREDFITKLALVDFTPAARCPLWDKFLDRIMGGNATLISYLQRIAGLCLTGDVSEQILPILYGPGANGKNTFVDTLTELLGDYAGEAPPDLLTVRRNDEHPTEIADLCGKRFVVASETEENRRLRVQLVKRLTGNARLKARYMRRDYFQFDRTHKMILVTNNRPVVRENTIAIWRRLRLIPFGVVIPEHEQDKSLGQKLRSEFPGILDWAVEGCLAWLREGLQTPPEVEAATQDYRADEDVLADFFSDRCISDSSAFAARAELFTAYETWAADLGERHPLARRSFYGRVRRLDGVSEDRRKIAGKAVRIFSGIGLQNQVPVTGGDT